MDKITEIMGQCGKLISYSKGRYRWDNPQNIIIYNANICTLTEKIWYGDVDLTIDLPKIKRLSKYLQKKILVLREMDARFENEDSPLLENAEYTTDGNHDWWKDPDKVVNDNGIWVLSNFTKQDTVSYDEASEVKYEKNEYPLKIELPNPIDLAFSVNSDNTDDTPILKFYEFLTQKLICKVDELEINSFIIEHSDYNRLKKLEYEYLRDSYENLHPYEMNTSFFWHWLNYGPTSAQSTEWVKKGFVYVKQNFKR